MLHNLTRKQVPMNSKHYENLARITNSYSASLAAASIPFTNVAQAMESLRPKFDSGHFATIANTQIQLIESVTANIGYMSPSFEITKEIASRHAELQKAALSSIASVANYSKIDFNPWAGTIADLLSSQASVMQNASIAMTGIAPTMVILKTQFDYLNSLPNLDFRIKTYSSQLTDIIEERVSVSEEFYYPPKEEINEFVDNFFHDSIGSDILPNEQQDYQDNPQNEFEEHVSAKKINESIHKTELLSDMKDPWFHLSVIIRQSHEIFIVGVISYIAGFFDYDDFVIFYYALLKLFGLKD